MLFFTLTLCRKDSKAYSMLVPLEPDDKLGNRSRTTHA